MECFIDGKSTCERTFWNRLNVLANFQQKEMIMDGLKVRVAESVYWIQPKKVIRNQIGSTKSWLQKLQG